MITCCPRCGSEMMLKLFKPYLCELGGVCSSNCMLDDRELALKQAKENLLIQDAPNWNEWEKQVTRILSGDFVKPYRPHTVYR
jgi:hypothetical protein